MSPAPVERERPDLSNGGIVAVMLGKGGDMPSDYAYHAQVLPIEGWKLDLKSLDHAIPHNTKALIFGDGEKLPRDIYEGIHDVLKKRRVQYMNRSNVESVKQALDDVIPARNRPRLVDEGKSPSEILAARAEEPKKTIAGRGQVKGLVESYMPDLLKDDPLMPVAEAARRLFRMASAAGITSTTVESIAQAVRTWKKDHGTGERPKSATPEHVLVQRRIEAAIIELQQCLAYIKGLEARNAELERQVAKAKEVFAAFQGDVFT